jgi:8-oxo-dGTP pyrophosphatase MutT (NUDIX family)
MVEEIIDGKLTLNQPAGHLEARESLIEAVIRETQEETAWLFRPEFLTGIYRWQVPQTDDTYMRYSFTGQLIEHDADREIDSDIEQVIWLTYDQLTARQHEMRSPLVMDCINDYLSGQRYPLTLLHN